VIESEAKTSEVPDLLRKGKEEISKRRLNWLQILVTAVVTGGVTIATGLILSHFQAREPYLVYSTTDTIPFLGHNQVLAIYQVSIGNEGKKAVEDVNCIINIPAAAIEQKRITADPALSYSESSTGDSLKLSFPLLNPSELVQVSILATAPTQLPNRPQVSLRGKGVSGQEKKIEQQKTGNPLLSVITAIIGVFGGFLSILLYRRDIRRELFELLWGQSKDQDKEMVEEQKDQEFHAEDQRRIL
jgi:hypothetical protein